MRPVKTRSSSSCDCGWCLRSSDVRSKTRDATGGRCGTEYRNHYVSIGCGNNISEDLAAGLREPGALDHRAAPDVAGPLGDAARGLPLDARPGADRAEDRRSRGAGRAAWLTIDPKLRSSIIEGLSVFLSVFDLPDVGATFCPPKPAREQAGSPADPPTPPCSPAAVARRLPPLDQVIDEGKVVALNMPAGMPCGGPSRFRDMAGKVVALNMPAGIDRGWGTDLAERDIHPAPAGRRRTASVRGCRCGRGRDPGRRLTPEMAGRDREHADVSGYGTSRVGRSAHVWSGIPGTPGPRSRSPMRLSRRGGPSVPSAEDAVPPRSTPDGGSRHGPPVPSRYRGLAGNRDDRARYPGAGGCLIPWRFRTRPESWSAPPHRTSGRCRLSTGKPRSPRPRVGPIAANVRPS